MFDALETRKKGYTSEPYGEIWWQTADDVYNPMRFAQGYFDHETRLHKVGVRYYDENRARFTQVDPIKGSTDDPVTLNLYQYGQMSR